MSIRGTIQQAIFKGFAVHFIYIQPKKVTTRLVLPFKMRTANRFIGLDFGRNDLREFLIDRIWRIAEINPNNVFTPFPMRQIECDR